eukprot:COSAG02_NODE_1927_length_10340_cov_2.510497_9_plen_264_part_00
MAAVQSSWHKLAQVDPEDPEVATGEHQEMVDVSLDTSGLLETSLPAELFKDGGKLGDAVRVCELRLDGDIREYGERSVEVARCFHSLASDYRVQGRFDQALALYRKATDINEALFQKAADIEEKALGPDHLDLATTWHNMAVVYKDELDQALALYRKAADIEEKVLGPDHPELATTWHNMAGIYIEQDELDQALALYRKAADIREKALGPDHPDLATTWRSMARVYEAQGQLDQALELLRLCGDDQDVSSDSSVGWDSDSLYD